MQGWFLTKISTNPNRELVEALRLQLRDNDGFCPNKPKGDEKNRCICFDFLSRVESGYVGPCGCGLYIAEEEHFGSNK